MKYRYFIIWLVLALSTSKVHGSEITISGTVRDNANGELLIGASISTGKVSTLTNSYGFFSLTIPDSTSTVMIRHLGYETLILDTLNKRRIPMDIRLVKSENRLAELTVTDRRLEDNTVGKLSLQMDKVRTTPALLGEVDIMKVLALTPGVSAGVEGSAGLYVRGGTPDQNLILLDEVPVYNVMHLGGFFSVFNTAAIKSVDFYKGAFPATYGGRLSSVVDIKMKDGNNKKIGAGIDLGLLNQSVTIEGPIVKDKSSFIVSGRTSTVGLASLLAGRKNVGSGERYTYWFYDLSVKVTHQINKTDQIYLSFYNGFDRFKYTEWLSSGNGQQAKTAVGNIWGNSTGTVRYSKMFSPKLFSRTTFLYSHYTSAFNNEFSGSGAQASEILFRKTDAAVHDFGMKFQLEYFPSNAVDLKIGADLIRHIFNPFTTASNYTTIMQGGSVRRIYASQVDGFVDAGIWLSSNLRINPGFRLSSYRAQRKTYVNPEPRLGVVWNVREGWKVTSGVAITNQYLHLLTNNGYGFGYDAWVPSTFTVPPSRARQVSFGLSRKLSNKGVDISIEVFSKKLQNLIDYPDGTNFTGLLAESWEKIVELGGNGKASGLEVMINKETGKFTGWISYTLSKSERKFDEINLGNWYPIRYDRRHNLAATGSLSFGSKWALNGSFIFQSGNAITLPTSAVMVEDEYSPKFVYSKRNNGRLPAYHRLDIGAVRKLRTARGRKAELNLGLYNAYNRRNPVYLDLRVEREGGNPYPKSIGASQYSLFPLLPYITYSLRFN